MTENDSFGKSICLYLLLTIGNTRPIKSRSLEAESDKEISMNTIIALFRAAFTPSFREALILNIAPLSSMTSGTPENYVLF